ncbi:hypothetical protein KTD31_17375 [Burkholderia multivorans]|uniref:hypothetical protein n=1 Tax=Burkholderia multivorans TaxID=87883 RepID=UPI001C213389|nr:hypothetical protein [Burkholderia multivorans]MBU9203130.1 hypothetical protein [Burkholderia multivorans]
MAQKVTINKPGAAPAAQAPAADALPENVVVDPRGRRLVLREPDFLTESRIMRALGDAASNTSYVLAYVMPAVQVVEIDGAMLPPPTTLEQIEAAIARLGRDGTTAVLEHVTGKAKAARESAEGEAGQVASLKNS